MKPETKFKIKTYLYYLVIEPWVTKISLPNFQTVSMFLLFFSILYRAQPWMFIFFTSTVLLYFINEFKSGKYVYWYRQRQFKRAKKLIKKNKEGHDERNLQGMQTDETIN